MNDNQMVAAMAAQNAAMQQVMNPANGAAAPAAEAPKSKLDIATSNSYSDQHDAFGTHFGKTKRDKEEELLKRVREQLANLPKWEANLKALEAELQQKQATAKFEELKAMYAFLTPEQKAALAAS